MNFGIVLIKSIRFPLLFSMLLGAHALGNSKILPTRIKLGPDFGYTANNFIASKAYEDLILPTPKDPASTFAFSWGGTATALWDNHLSLSFSPHRETYRVSTEEQIVSFANDPFPHTLQSTTEFTYNIWPISMGYHWKVAKHFLQCEIGVYQAFLDTHAIEWTVDGRNEYSLPSLNARQSNRGVSLGIEYGHQLGAGQAFVGMEVKNNSESMLAGLDGSLKVVSARLHLGYLWTVPLKLY